MLPKALPSSGKVGEVARGAGLDLLAGVPICGFAGDQAAALFGQGCFKRGMAKNTYGTGCFTLMNIGGKSLRSSHGLLTSVAWEAGGQRAYAMEGSAFNTGAAIQWLRDELGLISTAKECDRLAESVESSGGVYFVPAFTGLGAPYWDMYARGLLCGITRGTGRAHIARSVLESIAYQVTDLVETMQLDTQCAISELRVDGGASVSNILMSLQADMLGIPVNRPRMTETTAFGAAALAGLAAGFWSGLAELEKIRVTDRVFTPSIGADRRRELYAGWKEAVERARS
jgi:glycerol kinase